MSEPRELTKEELEIELMACFKVPRELIRGHIAALNAKIERLEREKLPSLELIAEMRKRAKEIDFKAVMKFSTDERARLSGIAKFISDAADYAETSKRKDGGK